MSRSPPQPSSLQHRADSAQRSLPDTTGKSRDGIGQSDAVAKHCAARLLLQMAAYRFAREVLAFQRLHFVTVGIGSFDLSQIQRLLSKTLAFADFSPVCTLRRRSIFCFSRLGDVRGWHAQALFLQNPELTVADSSCVQHLALQVLYRVCGFFGNNRLGVFFRRLLPIPPAAPSAFFWFRLFAMPRVSTACAYTPYSALLTVGGVALLHHAFILVRGAFHRHNANGGRQEQLRVTKQLFVVSELLVGQAGKIIFPKTADKEIPRKNIIIFQQAI